MLPTGELRLKEKAVTRTTDLKTLVNTGWTAARVTVLTSNEGQLVTEDGAFVRVPSGFAVYMREDGIVPSDTVRVRIRTDGQPRVSSYSRQ